MTEPTSDYGRLQEWVQTHVPASRRAKALEILRGVFDEKKITYDEFFKSPHMAYGWAIMGWTLANKGSLDDVKTFKHPDFTRFVATPELESAEAWRNSKLAEERLRRPSAEFPPYNGRYEKDPTTGAFSIVLP